MPAARMEFDPRREDFAPYGFACDLWRPGRMLRADRHNEIELNLLPDCSLTYLMAGRREAVQPGRLAVFWAATPHQIVEYSRRRPYYVATVPLAWFLEWKLPHGFVQRVLAGELVKAPSDSQAESDRHLFAQWTRDFEAHSSEGLRAAVLEMEARLRRLASARAASVSAQQSALAGHLRPALNKIEGMAAWIAQHYAERVRLADVGTAVGLHPNYAADLFRKAFGTTINASITAHRIAHAQRLLVVSDRKILDLALASGFNSLSRFNAAFRRACGCTPREYRRRHWLGGGGKKRGDGVVGD